MTSTTCTERTQFKEGIEKEKFQNNINKSKILIVDLNSCEYFKGLIFSTERAAANGAICKPLLGRWMNEATIESSK